MAEEDGSPGDGQTDGNNEDGAGVKRRSTSVMELRKNRRKSFVGMNPLGVAEASQVCFAVDHVQLAVFEPSQSEKPEPPAPKPEKPKRAAPQARR